MEKPTFTMPEDERDFVRGQYENADVILEYGSGGSTIVAAEMEGKEILAVENDVRWAQSVQDYAKVNNLPSQPIIHVVDLGSTGRFAKPFTAENYRNFPDYPISVWDQAYFKQPDVVLIDGRARTGCLVATMLRTKKPVTVMFDDYRERPEYHVVEELIEPSYMIGRMAVFDIEPTLLDASKLNFVARSFVSVSTSRERKPGPLNKLRRKAKRALNL